MAPLVCVGPPLWVNQSCLTACVAQNGVNSAACSLSKFLCLIQTYFRHALFYIRTIMEEVQILKARGRVRKTKLLVWKASADFTGEETKYKEIKQLFPEKQPAYNRADWYLTFLHTNLQHPPCNRLPVSTQPWSCLVLGLAPAAGKCFFCPS